MDNELKYNTLYDHYKDSITYLKEDIGKRDSITLKVFLSFIIYFIVDLKPSHSVSIANSWIKDKAGISLGLNYSIISTAILLVLLWYIIKYFQMCLNIEKQYDYIHKLEKKLNEMTNEKLITREGHSYLKEYPLLSALIHRIYNFFLPIGISMAMIYKIFIAPIVDFGVLSMVNILIQLLIVLCSFLYLLFVYREVDFVKELNNVVKKIFIKIHLYKED